MLDVDALSAFVAVIDSGSFSAAAERLGQTPSGVSRTISRLEAGTGVTLITRTTRRLDLTVEGEWLLARARRILADLQATEQQLARRRAQPEGLVRINAATPVLDHLLAPVLADFLDAYPRIRLELDSGEQIVNLIEERADLAIRIGELSDSSLNARRLGSSRLRLVASPAYLARRGKPKSIDDLAGHQLLGFTLPASLNVWPLAGGKDEGMQVRPAVAASSGETLRHLAQSGVGIACLADYLVRADLAGGRLQTVLEDATLPRWQPVWAVFYKQGRLAPRVTAVVDFLAGRLRAVGLDE